MPPRTSGFSLVAPCPQSLATMPTQARLVELQRREHPGCVVCSPDNPNGLRLKFAVRPDGSVAAVFDCLPVLQSYPAILHGGVIATILDSAMLYALFAIGLVAVTASLEVRYLAPTALGRFAVARAWTIKDCHPLYVQQAELVQDNKVVVEAQANFVVSEAA